MMKTASGYASIYLITSASKLTMPIKVAKSQGKPGVERGIKLLSLRLFRRAQGGRYLP